MMPPAGATSLSQINVLEADSRIIWFRKFLQNWGYYSINPQAARTGWKEAGRSPILAPFGDNLAVGIFHLKNRDERRYRRLIERVRLIEPDLQAINFYVGPDQLDILPFVTVTGADQASWVGLSDGTLRALALSYLVELSDTLAQAADSPPPLLLIEEPENGLYGGSLRALLEEFENCAPLAQIIFTSHSPFFIDLFGVSANSVTVLHKEHDRTSIVNLEGKTSPSIAQDLTLSERYFAELLQ
jgi:predicted ATPase